MINTFALVDNRLIQEELDATSQLHDNVVWVDLLHPTPEERDLVFHTFAQKLPDIEELAEIESSARFYIDEDGVNLHLYFLYDLQDRPRNISVGFTLNKGRLFTLHNEDLRSFRLFRMRARNGHIAHGDAVSVLLGIVETKVGLIADILEKMHTDLDGLSHMLFTENERNMQEMLTQLSRNEDVIGKIRLNLLDNQRTLGYMARKPGLLNEAETVLLREILGDMESLLSHCAFLFNKVNLLMDATLGSINIEQNNIIKMFSVVAVILMPPTLIASIYGMNFRYMPELENHLGYPMALLLMVGSAILPYLYFKKKRWL